jgi:hypothetical protein
MKETKQVVFLTKQALVDHLQSTFRLLQHYFISKSVLNSEDHLVIGALCFDIASALDKLESHVIPEPTPGIYIPEEPYSAMQDPDQEVFIPFKERLNMSEDIPF